MMRGFVWHCAVGGVLSWLVVGLLWWTMADLKVAIESLCSVGAIAGGWLGYGVVAVWLLSTALAAVLGLLAFVITSITAWR